MNSRPGPPSPRKVRGWLLTITASQARKALGQGGRRRLLGVDVVPEPLVGAPHEAVASVAISQPRRSAGRRLAMLALTMAAAIVLTLVGLQLVNRGTPSAGVAPLSTARQTDTPSLSPSAVPSPSPSPTPSPAATTSVDSTGILIIGLGEQVQAVPPNEPFAVAFDGFVGFVTVHPKDLGYSWIDPDSKEMVLSATTDKGRALIEDKAGKMEFPYRIRNVEHSYAELQRIMDDATRLVAAGVPDAELIYMLYPDERDNRTLIVIRQWSRPLVDALAERFPPDALAILVDPSRYGAGTAG